MTIDQHHGKVPHSLPAPALSHSTTTRPHVDRFAVSGLDSVVLSAPLSTRGPRPPPGVAFPAALGSLDHTAYASYQNMFK